jgi:hypothetical protein
MKKSNFFFLKKGLAHQKLVEAFLHTGKHFRKLLWVLNSNVLWVNILILSSF